MINKIKTKAVYAGSFDPPTNGHMWVIEQGSNLYDELVIAVGVHSDKKDIAFSVADRLKMLAECTKNLNNISFGQYENKFLVNYASKIGADYIIRGIRDLRDFEYEKTMLQFNRKINPNIKTIFFIPPTELCEVSSSSIKSLIGPDGWETIVTQYVPKPVFKELQKKYNQK
jgi:pantetheine-phosphate adenylyltransferase/8-oxo-dGTP diphosphatase